jgi:hypothetical protein
MKQKQQNGWSVEKPKQWFSTNGPEKDISYHKQHILD